VRIALVVHETRLGVDANLRAIREEATEAADAGAALVVFPEAALTGLINNDDPAHDLPLGQTVPGPATDAVGTLARERRLFIAFGLLERDRSHLYDSAVLLDPEGTIALRYRRIHPGWHGRRADASVYRHGAELSKVGTSLGTFAFLICGDLFDDEIPGRARALRADWLLFPFWRCFDDLSHDQQRWDREELPEYARRAAQTETTTLMVNALAPSNMEGGAFGGATVVGAGGSVRAAFPLGSAGTLLLDL
jgi:N-carbamoylputrescine amidase